MSATKLQEIETTEASSEEEIHHEVVPSPVRHNRKLYTLIGAAFLVFLLGGGGILLKQKSAAANPKAVTEVKPAAAPVPPSDFVQARRQTSAEFEINAAMSYRCH